MSPVYVVDSEQGHRTPPWLFQLCQSLIGDPFALDAFADAESALCSEWYGTAEDGLVKPWADPTFANPPFRLMGQVVTKAVAEWRSRRRVRTVLLGPAGCSQRWLHELWPWATVYWPDKRISYLDPRGRATLGAMQDSAVYVVGGVQGLHRAPVVKVLRVREAGA